MSLIRLGLNMGGNGGDEVIDDFTMSLGRSSVEKTPSDDRLPQIAEARRKYKAQELEILQNKSLIIR